jgi:predicted PurR-regulated permease PerM
MRPRIHEARIKPLSSDQSTGSFIELAIRLGVLFALIYLSLVLIRPFVTIGIWSIVLTVALFPPYEWVAAKLGGRRKLAAALVTIASLAMVIGPATWLILGLIESLRIVIAQLDLATASFPPPSTSVRDWPVIGEPIYRFWELASNNLQAALAKIGPELRPIGTTMLRLAGDASAGLLKFLIGIILAGFLLVPAPTIARAARRAALRLSPERGAEFLHLAGSTINAVLRGVIGISMVQALCAGVALTIANVPGATLLTSAVLLSSILQIGPALVLIPVMIWSWTAMDTLYASMFCGYMLLVTFLDNVLRPFVLGHGLNIPVVVILIGVIGGTLGYGITGIFLGPIVLAVIWSLLIAWINENSPA